MSFHAFESFEKMQEFMRARTAEANEDLADEQRGVTWGDSWVRFDNYGTVGVEFGQVFTQGEQVAGEIDAGATPAEAARILADSEVAHADGYLFGIAYSVLCPEGELGSTHRANLWPIEPEVVDAAMAVRWRIEALPLVHRLNLSIAFEEWKKHQLRLIHDEQAVIAHQRREMGL